MVYWFDGFPTLVGDGNATGSCIVEDDGIVFIAGSESNGTYSVAKYWRNGKAFPVSSGAGNASASAIVIVDL